MISAAVPYVTAIWLPPGARWLLHAGVLLVNRHALWYDSNMACNYKKIYSRLVVLLVAGILLAGCGTDDTQVPRVRLGYLQGDLHHLPAFVALDAGLYQAAGLQVEVGGVFRAGPELMSALAAGAIDVGFAGQAPATAAILNGVADACLVAQVNRNGSGVVVRADATFADACELAGRLVAIPGHATMQDFLLRRLVAACGPDAQDVRTIVLKPPEMLAALQSGAIDAFIAWEPYPTQAVQAGTARLLVDSRAIWPGHPCCVIVAARAFTRQQPAAMAAMQAVHARSCQFIRDNPARAAVIGSRYTGLAPEIVRAAMQHIDYTDTLDRDAAAAFVTFLRTQGYLRSGRFHDRVDLFLEASGPSRP